MEAGRHGWGRERPDGLEITGGKLHEASVHGQERRIVMALTVAGFVTGETKIDTAEAVNVSYPGFFQQIAGLGVKVS